MVAGHQVQVVAGPGDGAQDALFLQQHLGDGHLGPDAQGLGALPLGVGIHQQHAAAALGQAVGQVDGGGGLAHSALGHGDSNGAHGGSLVAVGLCPEDCCRRLEAARNNLQGTTKELPCQGIRESHN